jgi:hypothetical protein
VKKKNSTRQRKIKRRKPFLVFIGIVSVLFLAATILLQSRPFAYLLTEIAFRSLPDHMGIEGEFSEIDIKLFPPGIDLHQPSIQISKQNSLGLPGSASLNAKKVGLRFYPLQMLSGSIRVHELIVFEGNIRSEWDQFRAKDKAKELSQVDPFRINWDELFNFKVESIQFYQTQISLEVLEPGFGVDFLANSLRLSQWSGRGGVGYELDMDLKEIEIKAPEKLDLPQSVSRLQGLTRMNPLGTDIEGWKLEMAGLTLSLDGAISGDFFSEDRKLLEAELKLDTKFSELEDKLRSISFLEEVQGDLGWHGKLKLDLMQPKETFSLEGQLVGNALAWKGWNAERFIANGRWRAQRGASWGEMRIDGLEVSSSIAHRAGGRLRGRGGQVKVAPFTVFPGELSELELDLQLDGAHLHWLVGPKVETIFPLELRGSGPVKLNVKQDSEGEGWKVFAAYQLKFSDLILDTLSYAKELGEVTKILQVAGGEISGRLEVDQDKVLFEENEIVLPESRLRASGSVDFEKGFALRGQSTINLKDIDKLIEIPIRGQGGLDVEVSGPFSDIKVLFKTSLVQSEYIGLKLGNLRGDIELDLGSSVVSLKNVRATKAQTRYRGTGKIWFGENNKIDLPIEILEGETKDLLKIFENLTEELSWLPRSTVGRLKGSVHVHGGVSLDQLKVDTKIDGTDWGLNGERFRTIDLTGGYDRGRFFLSRFETKKNQIPIIGQVSYAEGDGIQWEIKGVDVPLADFDLLTRSNVPLKGVFSFQSAGRGQLEDVASQTKVSVRGLSLSGKNIKSSEIDLVTHEGSAHLRANLSEDEGVLDLRYGLKKGSASSLSLYLSRFDFSPFLLFLNSDLRKDPVFSAHADGRVELRFLSGEMEYASGEIGIESFDVKRKQDQIRIENPLRVSVDRGSFEIKNHTFLTGTDRVFLNVKSRAALLNGSLKGDVSLSVLEYLTNLIERATGKAHLDLQLGGTLIEPALVGRVSVAGARVHTSVLESPIENIDALISVEKNKIYLRSLDGVLAGGRVAGKGEIILFATRFPELNLHATLSGSRIRLFPFQYIRTKGDVFLRGVGVPYRITGDLVVDSALIREPFLQRKTTELRRVARFRPPESSTDSGEALRFELGLNVRSNKGIFIQNDLFDAELKGDIQLVNTVDAPRVMGTAEIIRGRLLFRDQDFSVESAQIDFDNPTIFDPRFSMTARTEVRDTDIRIFTSGRLSQWNLELNSTPALPENEILSLLAIGLTSEALSRREAGGGSAFQQSDAASLLLHSLNFNRDIRKRTGLEIGVEETSTPQVVSPTLSSQQQPVQSSTSPKIVIKRELGERLDVSVGTTVGVGSNIEREVNAEIRLRPGVSLRGVWNSYGGEGPSATELESQTSYGVDLKFQKGFR